MSNLLILTLYVAWCNAVSVRYGRRCDSSRMGDHPGILATNPCQYSCYTYKTCFQPFLPLLTTYKQTNNKKTNS